MVPLIRYPSNIVDTTVNPDTGLFHELDFDLLEKLVLGHSIDVMSMLTFANGFFHTRRLFCVLSKFGDKSHNSRLFPSPWLLER